MRRDPINDTQPLDLPQAATLLLEECRMVLPGIQALFGFQLIAVFSDGFFDKLGTTEQRLHLAAIVFVVLAIGMIMAPAAYHRQTSPMKVSSRFVGLSTRLLLWSMPPLALGFCTDFYIVGSMIVQPRVAAYLSAALLLVLFALWYLLPLRDRSDSP